MKLDIRLPQLEALIDLMGASRSNWTPDQQPLLPRTEIQARLGNGITIDLADVEVGPANLLTYKGEQVLLYIPEPMRRFHIAECRTLAEMRDRGRLERYVVTNRTDGLFRIARDGGTTDVPLKVCMNCLEKLNWKNYENYNQRQQIRRDFDIADFLFEYATIFQSLPTRRAEDVTDNHYAHDWKNISRGYRERQNWLCEGCDVNLSEHKNLLHCHHVSGVLSDNRDANLKALCMLCHAEQPMHGHMKVPLKHGQAIESLRRTPHARRSPQPNLTP